MSVENEELEVPESTEVAEVVEETTLRTSLADALKEARDRDEQGRFKAKEAEAAPVKESTGSAAEGATAPVALTPSEVSWKNPASASRWTQKQWWASLTPEAQREIAAREDEVHVGMTRQDEERSFARDIQKAIAPYAAMIAAEGATPATAVQSLFNTAYVLRSGTPQQKQQALASIAQQYQIPLETLTQQQGQADPAYQQLQNETLALRRQLEQVQSGLQAQSQAAVQGEIQAFAADPKNVHLEAVRADMAALLQTGRAKDLQDAYDKACWAVPEIRSKLQAELQQKAEAERISTEKAKAGAAKQKAVSVRGGPGALSPTAAGSSNSSLREQLRSAMRDAQGQV